MVVLCKLSVIFANLTVTEEHFQISFETLFQGAGLSYQVIGTGLGDDEVDVQLAWVGGGGPSEEVDPTIHGFDGEVTPLPTPKQSPDNSSDGR